MSDVAITRSWANDLYVESMTAVNIAGGTASIRWPGPEQDVIREHLAEGRTEGECVIGDVRYVWTGAMLRTDA